MRNITKKICNKISKNNIASYLLPLKDNIMFSRNKKYFSSNETINSIKKYKQVSTGIPGNMGMDHIGIVVPSVQKAAEFLSDVFDADFDWEVIREDRPTAGERGWDKTFNIHPDSALKHVIMLKCGDHPLTQYIELFEFKSPDQKVPTGLDNWFKFSDIGNSYISFTFKDINKVVEHLNKVVIPKWGVRFIQPTPMKFPLRGEVCESFFITTPWGQWIELTSWSESKSKSKIIRVQRGNQDDTKINQLKNSYLNKSIYDLPTPSFLIDLDIIDHNISIMKEKFKGIRWIIPSKMHKCPKLTEYILNKTEANGILCLTLNEAEKYVHSNIDAIKEKEVFLATQVAAENEFERISLLAKKVNKLKITIDNKKCLTNLVKAIEKWEITSPIEIFIEVNIGHNRFGVDNENEALELAKLIKDLQTKKGAVSLGGVCGYEGHTPIMPKFEKLAATKSGHELLLKVKNHLEINGHPIKIISAGGSSNYNQCLEVGIIDEIQAGGGIWCDLLYYKKAGLSEFNHKIATSILSTIISSNESGNRIVCDAGFKCLGFHPFADLPEIRNGKYKDLFKCSGVSAEVTRFTNLSYTHMNIPEFKYGNKIELDVGYSDAMGFLNRFIFVHRNSVVQDVLETFSDSTWV